MKKRMIRKLAVGAVLAAVVTAETLTTAVSVDSSTDAAWILRYSVGLEAVSDEAADINGDGSITPYDAALMLRATPAPTETVMPSAILEATSTPVPTPTTTAESHIHSWTKQREIGHYESCVIGTEEIAVGTYWEEIGGWDEKRAAYYRCNDCGAEFSSNLEAGDHILSAYHSSYSYYPAETIHHNGEWVERTRYETRNVYEDVWVVDSEACWTCSHGEIQCNQH